MSIVSFADIQGHNEQEKEVEALLSLNSVSPSRTIRPVNERESTLEVAVSLAAADQAELRQLIEHVVEEIVGQAGWER